MSSEEFEFLTYTNSEELLPQVPKKKEFNKASLVPEYDPTMSRTTLDNYFSSKPTSKEIEVHLTNKGWPAHLVSIFSASNERKGVGKRQAQVREVQSRRSSYIEASKSKAMIAQYRAYSKGLGRSTTAWNIRVHGKWSVVDKPSIVKNGKGATIDTQSFKRWVFGQGSVLKKFITKKTQFISGNLACHTLFYARGLSMPEHELRSMLDSAVVYLDSYEDITTYATPLTLASFVEHAIKEVRGLFIGNEMIRSIPELMKIQDIFFPRHKPLFRACLAYFADVEINGKRMDPARLQSQLSKSFPQISVQQIREAPKPVDFSSYFTFPNESKVHKGYKEAAERGAPVEQNFVPSIPFEPVRKLKLRASKPPFDPFKPVVWDKRNRNRKNFDFNEHRFRKNASA